MEKQYITLSLDELVPYENNPRLNDDAVADVMESIKQTGNNDPIEIDENNVILSGHTRLKALKQLGYAQTECLRISGMTEEQKRKYRILANKTAEKADWDLVKLEQELAELDFEGYDFDFDGVQIETEPTELDDDTKKNTVVVSINCGDINNYEEIKERLQNICDEVGAKISVKMQ